MNAEDSAREALQQDVERNRQQTELVHESRVLLTGFIRTELRDELRIAVAEGIAAAMTDDAAERFWTKGFEVAQKEARKRVREGAGDLVLGAVRSLFKWGSMAVILLAFAYYVGGWSLMKAVWAAVTKG